MTLLVCGVVVTRHIAMSPQDVMSTVSQLREIVHPSPGHPHARPTATPPPPVATEPVHTIFNVPNVCGLQAAVAARELSELGLKVASRTAPSTQGEGIVVEQSPSADAEVLRGNTVTLTVSSGAAWVTVPDLKDKTEAQARDILAQAGLASRTLRRHDMRAPQGTVLQVQPASGARMREGSAVLLVVSGGPYSGHVVPDVMGLSYDQALSAAGQSGMLLQILRETGDRDAAVVKGQRPMPGTELPDPPPALLVVLGPPAPKPSSSPSAVPGRGSGGQAGASPETR